MASESIAVTPAMLADGRGEARRLDRTLFGGVTWIGGIKGVTLSLTWLSTVIVARLLTPADYGLVAMATVYLGLTSMITDFGLGSAIVALDHFDERVAAQLHSVSMVVGVAAFLVSCTVAAPLGRFYGTASLIPVIIVLSVGLVLDAMRVVPMAILARRLQFKQLSLLEALKALSAVASTLALAFWGAKYWALVVGNVLASFVLTAFVLVTLPQRLAWPRLRELRSTLTFSSHFLFGQLAWYGYSNADFVVAGRVLGRVALGEYTMAWTLTSAPADKIMAVFGRVMPTMFAAVQRDVAALRRYFLLFTEALGILIVPAGIGLALVARDFVLLVFGAKWAAAVVPVQILCLYTVVHILTTPLASVLQVRGQASFPMRMGLLALAVLPPAFCAAGWLWGTRGVAGVWLVIYPLILLPIYRRVLRVLDMSVRDYFSCLTATLSSAAIMIVVVFLMRDFAAPGWSLISRFAAEVISGAAAFIGSALVLHRRRLGALAEFVRAIRK